MARITDKERQEFHKLLDKSIDKLNSSKNINKIHWSKINNNLLKKMLEVEIKELDVAFDIGYPSEIDSECDDIINFAMFIKHNNYRRYN